MSHFPVGTRIRLFGVKSLVIKVPEGDVGILAAFEMMASDKASFPTFALE